MAKRPACTVVIPCYNYAHAVERAIESVRNQTMSNFECILVDDGSTDDPKAVFDRLVGDDERFKFIHQKNAGVANARNTGVFSGTGKYVCCLDADDALEPRFLYACVKYLEEHPETSIAYTGLYYKTPNGKEGLSKWPGECNYDEQIEGKNQIPTCNVARRTVWERLGGQRQRYAPLGAGEEDAEMWLRAGAYGFRAKKVTEAGLFLYSWMSGRVSGNKDHRMVDYRSWHPWVYDKQHPFMSVATPENKFSHPVRQYDEPLVSVIIPVGKGHSKTVIDALDSLDSQSLRKWEAIVVWDNDDDPGYIMRTFPYIKFVDLRRFGQVPRGAGYARNRGVEVASGSIVAFLDADDWLFPQALEYMFSVWEETGDIIYTDYVGKAYVTEDFAEEANQRGILLDYDSKSGQAVIEYHSKDYDCDSAIRQPDGEMYHWCIVTMLIPKAYHQEIGGFDENMNSWEDWDYQIRLAKAGRCFVRIPEPLVVYRFYTGERRQEGIDKYPDLVKYMQDKYKEIQTMGCGCNKRSSARASMSVAESRMLASRQQSGENDVMDDKNFFLINYKHPNTGQHRVLGPVTKIDYGYRGGGEQFLMHKADIESNPSIFELVRVVSTPPKQEERRQPPAPAIVPDLPPPMPVVLEEPEKVEEAPKPKTTRRRRTTRKKTSSTTSSKASTSKPTPPAER